MLPGPFRPARIGRDKGGPKRNPETSRGRRRVVIIVLEPLGGPTEILELTSLAADDAKGSGPLKKVRAKFSPVKELVRCSTRFKRQCLRREGCRP